FASLHPGTRYSFRSSLSAPTIPMPIINSVAAMQDEVAAWRRDMHENPEILYDVHRTAGVVAEKLKAFGCDEVVPGIGRTGVVGVIKGRKRTGTRRGLR